MSDDLVKMARLAQRDERMSTGALYGDLADRIEELEAELNLMKKSGIIEVSVRNASVMEYMKHWEGRAETAEAKLAKAMKWAQEQHAAADRYAARIEELEGKLYKAIWELEILGFDFESTLGRELMEVDDEYEDDEDE